MARKSVRSGILSLHERELVKEVDRIRSGENSSMKRAPSRLAELLPELDKRIDAVGEDLAVILHSHALRPFIASRVKELNILLASYQDFQQVTFGPDYSTWRIRFTKKTIDDMPGMKKWKKTPKQKRLERHRSYWLEVGDENAPKQLTLENIFSPDFAMRGIDGYKVSISSGKMEIRDILREALELEKQFEPYIIDNPSQAILPRSEATAAHIYDIKKRLDSFKKSLSSMDERKQVQVPKAALVEIQKITDPSEREARLAELFKRYEKPARYDF